MELELEEQKSKGALKLLERTHKFGKFLRRKGIEPWEPSGAECGFTNGTGISFSVLARPHMARDVDETLFLSSRKSDSLKKERDWWSADLEGEMEMLEVEGSFLRRIHGTRKEGGQTGQL